MLVIENLKIYHKINQLKQRCMQNPFINHYIEFLDLSHAEKGADKDLEG